jgi:hypothetical protein
MERVLPGIGRHEALVAGEFGLRAPGARPRWRDARAAAQRGRRKVMALKRCFHDGSSVVEIFIPIRPFRLVSPRSGAPWWRRAERWLRPIGVRSRGRSRFLSVAVTASCVSPRAERTLRPASAWRRPWRASTAPSWRRVPRGGHRRRVRPAARCPTGPGVTAPDAASSAATRRAPADLWTSSGAPCCCVCAVARAARPW